MTLYDTLGVERTADTATMRAAYRKAAKAAHPDAGGSPEKFAELGKALKVLTDPKLRDHYDRTGKVDEAPGGTPEGRAMEFAFSAMTAVIGALKSQNRDPAKIDLVEAAIESIRNTIRENKNKHAEAMKDIDQARKLGRRLKARRGKHPVLVSMWAATLRGMEEQADKIVADTPNMERAILILKDHRFEREPEEPVMRTVFLGGFGSASTSGTGSWG